jgi:hypothetical protein
MATLLTIPVIISVGDVSIYLSDTDNAKGALFGRRLSSPKSSVEIAMATDSLRWGYEGNPAASTLRETANYCLWLYGKYGQQAQYIISGTGGGSVIPIPGGNLPLPIQFIVSSSSYMVTGQSSKTISSFVGFNLLFARGSQSQSTINTEPTWYSWDRDTAAFTCTPAAQEGELYQFYAIS